MARLVWVPIALVLLAGCMPSPVADPATCTGDGGWVKGTPLDLIEVLKANGRGTLRFRCAHRGFVRSEHIPALIALLDSEEPCASVTLASSSTLLFDSTVGIEAAYLIEGYRAGEYPPDLNSTRQPVDREEILRWWRERSSSLAF